jgi:hypothetical protein
MRPWTASNLDFPSCSLGVVPIRRRTHDLAHPPKLINLVCAREDWTERRDFNGHRSHRPDIDRGGILFCSEKDFGRSVPSGGDVRGIWWTRPDFPGEAKVG